jgi:hypothetical protein
LQKLIKGEVIVKHKVTQRMKWRRHLNGMDDTELVKEITDWNFRSENKRTTED